MELEQMFREQQRALYAYFFRLVGDRSDAEDLTQETFTRACTAAMRFRGDASPKTWLFGIARNVLMEASRKGLFASTEDVANHDREADHDEPELRLDLERAFMSLDAADRETLLLVDYLGFSPTAAAELVGIEPGTFRMRLLRSRGRLRDHLGVMIDV
jgi:RNA polymerase sigma-70 factor (ECF subfamily)